MEVDERYVGGVVGESVTGRLCPNVETSGSDVLLRLADILVDVEPVDS